MKNFLLWELIKNILVLEFINTQLSLLQLSYSPRKPDTIEEKKEVLINAGSLYNVRNKFIEVFEDSFFFHLRMDFKKKSHMCSIKNYQIG